MQTDRQNNSRKEIGDCPDFEKVRASIDGKLSLTESEEILQHVRACPTCRDLLIQNHLDVLLNKERQNLSEDPTVNVNAPQHQGEVPTTKLPPVASSARSAADDQIPLVEESPSSHSSLFPPLKPNEIGRLGQFRLLKELGEGGMGTVFEAEDSQLGRRVAIKVLRSPTLDDSTRRRFMQEAKLAASLHSDRIVTIYHVGEDRGCPYLVMELLKGESLESYLSRKHTVNLTQALRITREAAEGLAIVHENSLIHRDIKPGNIWLEGDLQDLSKCRVKLLDFGIARPFSGGENLTVEGFIIGTPNYMCPEQSCGDTVDGRSDLFSLGCLLYAMLVGKPPFERSNTMLTIRAVADAHFEPLAETLRPFPELVQNLLKRLLSKNPSNRPASAREVIDEIKAIEDSLKNRRSKGIRFPPSSEGKSAFPNPALG